jgi:hypothetical protein
MEKKNFLPFCDRIFCQPCGIVSLGLLDCAKLRKNSLWARNIKLLGQYKCLLWLLCTIFSFFDVLINVSVQGDSNERFKCVLLFLSKISPRSRIQERTLSLRFLSIILKVLRLEVSVYSVYITNQFQTTFAHGRGKSKIR